MYTYTLILSKIIESFSQDIEQCGQVMANDAVRIQHGQASQIGINRALAQDDAMVGYVYQRPSESEFGGQVSAFQAKQSPRAWALDDDAIIDNVRLPIIHLIYRSTSRIKT